MGQTVNCWGPTCDCCRQSCSFYLSLMSKQLFYYSNGHTHSLGYLYTFYKLSNSLLVITFVLKLIILQKQLSFEFKVSLIWAINLLYSWSNIHNSRSEHSSYICCKYFNRVVFIGVSHQILHSFLVEECYLFAFGKRDLWDTL